MPTEPSASAGASTARKVAELWQRVAEERGLDFEPAPRTVEAAIPDLARAVDDISAGLADAQERRWLAALLAALSHHVEVSTLGGSPARDGVAVAVVTGRGGVLIGRRRDGIPRWVFPGGRIEDGEDPGEAAVRECAEETDLHVTVDRVIGQRRHPVNGVQVLYLACSPIAEATARVTAPGELVEVRWADLAEVEWLMPDLYEPVRDHLARMRVNGDLSR